MAPDPEVLKIEAAKRALEEYREALAKLRKEHREKINEILKGINERKIRKIKEDLGIE
jgi:DNA-binding MarR family transcriptional regulator